MLEHGKHRPGAVADSPRNVWNEPADGGDGPDSFSLGVMLLYGVTVSTALAAGFDWRPGALHVWYATTIDLFMVHATAELGMLSFTPWVSPDPSNLGFLAE